MGAVTKPDKLLSPQVKIACSFMCGCRRPLQDAVFQLGGGGQEEGVYLHRQGDGVELVSKSLPGDLGESNLRTLCLFTSGRTGMFGRIGPKLYT